MALSSMCMCTCVRWMGMLTSVLIGRKDEVTTKEKETTRDIDRTVL